MMRASLWLSSLNRCKRLLLPVAVAIGVRAVGVVWLSRVLSSSGEFRSHWMEVWLDPSLPEGFRGPVASSWLYLFHAWDSGFYVSIARNGYYHPAYAFLPAYPALIRFAGLLTGDCWSGAVLVTLFFSLASIVVFQLLAEEYMDKNEALSATLLVATFPYVALFTTISYSEAVFLFSSISMWFFYRKGRMSVASLCAGLAALTRLYGILIVLPMLLDILRSRNHRKCAYLAFPALAIVTWLLFCFFVTGDPMVSWTDQAHWRQSGVSFGLVQTLLLPALGGEMSALAFDPALLVLVSLFALLMVKVWDVDKMLWAYGAALLSLLILFGSITSLPRFLAFTFPIWLTVRVRNPVAAVFGMAIFVPLTLFLWLSALRGVFIA